ncbi:MAG TPA: polysaccharide deacetylase family protein [Cyclobacteriaceae bacterium]|nr:polysaccharide deacetylase family protein [Cyclobacteriaceae bacterium]
MSFFRTPFWIPLFYPDFLWRVKTDEPALYLSFDDGPVPGPTEFVLSQLVRYNAKASFFCVGDNILKHRQLYDQLIQQGHAVGNHTQHHLNGWQTDTDIYLEDFNMCQQNMQTNLFRPPYGRIRRKQAAYIKRSHKIVMWDVLSMDYRLDLSQEQCLKKSIESSRTGSIVVFHDSYKAEKNLNYVLPRYLEHFAEKGFKFLKL